MILLNTWCASRSESVGAAPRVTAIDVSVVVRNRIFRDYANGRSDDHSVVIETDKIVASRCWIDASIKGILICLKYP